MHGGAGGSTYEYLQLAPEPPESLWAERDNDMICLDWTPRPEADLMKYKVYRGEYPGFWTQGPMKFFDIAREDTTMVDSTFSGETDVYYVVTAVDSSGHGSTASPEVAVIFTGILDEIETPDNLPRTPYIISNYPNPFNSSTTIEYYIPDIGARPTQVQLFIYDALGRKVATLVDDRQYPGKHRTSWDGRTDNGTPAASGIYFAKLTLWGYEFASSAKLVLQK